MLHNMFLFYEFDIFGGISEIGLIFDNFEKIAPRKAKSKYFENIENKSNSLPYFLFPVMCNLLRSLSSFKNDRCGSPFCTTTIFYSVKVFSSMLSMIYTEYALEFNNYFGKIYFVSFLYDSI